MSEYGAGIYLDEYLDMVVDNTGDAKGAQGIEEVMKDVGTALKAMLEHGTGIERPESISNGVLGDPLSDGIFRDIELASTKIIDADPRIEYISRIRAGKPQGARNGVKIDCEVVIDSSEVSYDFVFEDTE